MVVVHWVRETVPPVPVNAAESPGVVTRSVA